MCWRDVEFLDEGVRVWLRKSKTDQRAVGRAVCLQFYPLREFCPVVLGRSLWITGHCGEFLVFRHRDGAGVSAFQLLSVLRKALVHLGLPPEDFGTHSFRIGAATEDNWAG